MSELTSYQEQLIRQRAYTDRLNFGAETAEAMDAEMTRAAELEVYRQQLLKSPDDIHHTVDRDTETMEFKSVGVFEDDLFPEAYSPMSREVFEWVVGEITFLTPIPTPLTNKHVSKLLAKAVYDKREKALVEADTVEIEHIRKKLLDERYKELGPDVDIYTSGFESHHAESTWDKLKLLGTTENRKSLLRDVLAILAIDTTPEELSLDQRKALIKAIHTYGINELTLSEVPEPTFDPF